MRVMAVIALSILGMLSAVRIPAAVDLPQPSVDTSIAQLAQALLDKDAGVCLAAIKALAGQFAPPSRDMVPGCLGRLNARPWSEHKRQAVLQAGVVPRLIEVVKSDLPPPADPQGWFNRDNPAWYAAVVLGRLKARVAVQPLIAALASQDFDTCVLSMWALGEIGDARALGPLFKSFGWSADWRGDRVNEWVYDAFRKIGKPAGEFLIPRVKNGSAADRRDALEALGYGFTQDKTAVGPVISALKDADPGVRAAAAQVLDGFGNRKAGYLLLDDNSIQPDVVRKAAGPLMSALDDPSPLVRAAAARTLGDLRYAPAVDRLIALFKDPDAQVRQTAACQFTVLKSPRALRPLIALLRDPDRDVRHSAIWTLGWLKTPGATAPLLALLPGVDAYARSTVAESLGYTGDKRAVEPLIGLLKDDSSDVRRNAASSLRTLRDPRASKPLIAALQDPDTEVQVYAILGLASIADPVAADYLRGALQRKDLRTIELAHAFFIRQGNDADVPALIDVLNNSGRESIAIDYATCGNPALEKAGKDYLTKCRNEHPPDTKDQPLKPRPDRPIWGSAKQRPK